jgi:hypothetical protein
LSARLRAAAGPTIVAIAVWCAAGRVAVATADAASTRLVVAAPWWWLVVGFALALAVPRLRHDPRFALPSLISTIPWWPAPLPPVALLWTGALAWMPIGLAVVAALVAGRSAAESTSSPTTSAAGAWRAAILTAMMAVAAAWSAAPHVPGGDEPHYLAITESLIRDGDLQIENNHDDPRFIAAFGRMKPDYVARGTNGEIYSIHAPGISTLVAPGYWMAGYRGAQVIVIGLAAWAGALVWAISWRATRSRRAAWFAWLAITASVTFLLQSFTVYPDGAGACAVAAAVWLIVRLADEEDRVPARTIVAVSAALAALPWLHTRFSVIAAGLGAIIAWQLTTTGPSGTRVRRLATFAAVPAVAAVAWFGYFVAIYGTLNPAAPYGDTSGPEGTHLGYAPGGFIGLFLDEQFGLFTYAPVLVVAMVGLARGGGTRLGRAALLTALASGLYLVAAATYWMWWAGVPATPARLVTATLPVFAVPLATAWARSRAEMRPALLMTLAITIALSLLVIGVHHAAFAWNVRDAEARWLQWLGPVVNLPRGWPSFFWQLDPGHPMSEAPFLVHAIFWLAVFAIGSIIVTRVARQRAWSSETTTLAWTWWLLGGLSIAVMGGWALTGGRPLNPARAQFSVLADLRDHRPVFRLAPGAIARVTSPAGMMRIAPDEVGPEGSSAWATWTDVPSGTYRVQVFLPRPRAGRVRVMFATGAAQSVDLQLMSEQSFTLDVPPGADWLTLAPEDGLQGVGGRVAIDPVTLAR